MPDICEVVHAATDDMAQDVSFYRMRVSNAITNLIGVPVKTIMRGTKAAYEKNPTKSNKKRYDIETRRYLEHTKLVEEMIEFTMKTGKEVNYNLHLANPLEIADSWRSIFARRLRGVITPKTILHGTRKIRNIRKLVQRIEKKREQLARKDKLQKSAIFLAPPEIIVSHFDKFGFLGGLIEKILTMGDRNIQESSKFLDPITDARTDLINKLKIQVRSSTSGFNINTSAVGGITGLTTMTGEKVIIHKLVETITGENVYKVTLENDDSQVIRDLPEEELGIDKSGVEDRLVKMYSDELMDDLGNGQVRYIVPQLLENASEDDLVKIKAILSRAYEEGQKEKGEKGQKVPGMHSLKVEIDDPVLGTKVEWEYTYIMVKQGEGSGLLGGKETYNTYLINKKEVTTDGFGEVTYFLGKTRRITEEEEIIDIQYKYKQNELDDVMGEGYWKSEEHENFGKHTYKRKESFKLKDGTTKDIGVELPIYSEMDIRGSQKKNWVNFKELKNQPDEKAMDAVWIAMGKIRDSYLEAFDYLRLKNKENLSKRASLHQTIINWRIKSMGDSIEDATVWLSDTLKSLDINEYISVNENGKIITSTTYAKSKKENYWPHMYHRENIFNVQLPAAVREIKKKITDYELHWKVTKAQLIEEEKYKGTRLEDLYIGLAHMEKMLNDYKDGLEVDMGSLNDLNVLKTLKHITSWTNPEMRRKDGGVHHDYFGQSFNTLHKNDIMIELLNAIYKMTRVDKNIPKGSLEYIINRVKIGFGDPTSRSQTLFGESSYQEMAEKMNGLPGWVFGGITHNPKSAEIFTKWLTAPASMMYLGGSSALGNSGQIVNQIMRVGWKIGHEAYTEYKNNKTYWDEIIRNTGILNVMTMFTDIMLKDGNPKWNDAGLVTVGGVPIPMINMLKFGRLLKMGRENFVKNGTDEMDAFLFKLLRNNEGETRSEIQRLVDINELRKGIEKKDLRKKRGQLFDIFTLEKDEDSAKIIEQSFRELVGKVADTQLKKMVSWKLSWWFDEWSGPGKDVFTFTGSEERLRTITAIMGLIHARETGILGDKENWRESMKSQMAVRIARNAVYYTQFGMTPPYLGEGFNGFGRALWQYKQYPTLQMIHDGQIWLSFMDGNYGMADGFWRVTKASGQAMAQFWKKGKSYDPADRNLDHEAIMMARWIGTRGIASVLAVSIGAIPFIGAGLRNIAPNLPIYSLFRGAENPAVGLMARSIIWSSMFMMGVDEEDERNDLTNTFGFFFAPVLLGMMIRGIMSSYEYFDS